MSEFKLLIDRLSDRPQRFAYQAEPRWWTSRVGDAEDHPADGAVDRPFEFEIEASRLGEGVLIEGAFTGGLSIECSRCTRRYAHPLRDHFRLVLKPLKEDQRGDARGHAALDPENERAIATNGMCLGDDLEAGWFRGPVVFLDDFFAEVVVTAMPYQPLCDEACPGLCPHCGIERRRGVGAESLAVCACEDERVESPFAALARLKVDEGSGDESERVSRAKVRKTGAARPGKRS